MGFFLRIILIAVLVFLIIRTVGSLFGLNQSKKKNFRKNKDEIRNEPNSKDREYKGGDYIDYEETK